MYVFDANLSMAATITSRIECTGNVENARCIVA